MGSNPRCDMLKYFDNIPGEGVAICKLCNQRLKNDRNYNLRKHMIHMHTQTEVWKYFDNILSGDMAVCKICKTQVRINRTFNLILHLKRKHEIYVESSTASLRGGATNRAKKRKFKQIEQATVSKCPKRFLYVQVDKKMLKRAVIGLLLEDCVQPQIFGTENMKALLVPICEALGEEKNKTIKIDEIETEKVLCSLATHLRTTFSNELHWRMLSLKIDADVNTNGNSFCLSVLFVKKAELQTRVLGIIDLGDKAYLTEEHIKEVLHKFNIDSSQIISAYCDDTKAHYNESVENCNYLDKINKFEIFNKITVGDIKLERYMGTNIQHCVLDLFKNQSIFHLFLQCRNVVKFIINSHEYEELFKGNNLSIPQLDSPWKWGSTYTMMKHLEDGRNVLKNIKYESNNCSEDNFNLDENLWDFITSYCKVLLTVQKALIKCYSEDLHIGDFYVQFLKCKLLVEKLLTENNHQNSHTEVIAETLVESLKQKSDIFLNQERFVACLYLDPRFQHTLSPTQKAQAHKFLKKLWTRAKIYNIDMPTSACKYTDSQEIHLGEQKSENDNDEDEDTFLNQFLSQNIQNVSCRQSDVYYKFETLKLPFRRVDVNVLKFWEDLSTLEPELYTSSEICFAIPATQVYNKTLYTDILSKFGNYKTSAFTKENLSIIRLNYQLIKDVIDTIDFLREPEKSAEENDDIVGI